MHTGLSPSPHFQDTLGAQNGPGGMLDSVSDELLGWVHQLIVLEEIRTLMLARVQGGEVAPRRLELVVVNSLVAEYSVVSTGTAIEAAAT